MGWVKYIIADTTLSFLSPYVDVQYGLLHVKKIVSSPQRKSRGYQKEINGKKKNAAAWNPERQICPSSYG